MSVSDIFGAIKIADEDVPEPFGGPSSAQSAVDQIVHQSVPDLPQAVPIEAQGNTRQQKKETRPQDDGRTESPRQE